MMPPKPGPPPGPGPSRRQVARRRIAAIVVLILLLGGLGWLAVAAIGGGSSKPKAASSTLDTSSLLYSTVTRTTGGKTTETVIAMPKPFHIVFPEGFTVHDMAARVGAVKEIAEHERHVRPLLSSRGYLAAVRRASSPPCLRGKRTRREGFLFPATYEFFAKTTNAQLVQDQLSAFCENWARVDLSYARRKNLTQYDVLIIASMQAAAHPARVNYLYFVRKPDKKHHFFTASAKAFDEYEAAHGYGQH